MKFPNKFCVADIQFVDSLRTPTKKHQMTITNFKTKTLTKIMTAPEI